MRGSRFALALVVGWMLLWTARPVQAQAPLSIQNRPTLSPWLNLYRRDPGPVGPYLSYVRPEQRLLRSLAQQRAGLARQGAAIGNLGNELSQIAPQTSIAPTGTAATFMNYSKYFNVTGSGGGGSAARSSGRSWTPPPVRSGGYSGY